MIVKVAVVHAAYEGGRIGLILGGLAGGGTLGVHDGAKQFLKNKKLAPEDRKSVAKATLKGVGKGAIIGGVGSGLVGAGYSAGEQVHRNHKYNQYRKKYGYSE